LLLLSLLRLPAAGFYPAYAAACATEATILQHAQQWFDQQPPEQQRSLLNGAALLSVHLSMWMLSLWTFTASSAPKGTCFSAMFALVAAPFAGLTVQQLLTCSVVTASLSSSSSSSSRSSSRSSRTAGGGGSSGSDVHPLLEAATSSLSQVYMTTNHVSCAINQGICLHARGQVSAAALQDATSDDVMRLLLVQLATLREQLYYQQRRKLRKAAAATPSSSNSMEAAAAAVDLPEPYHQQLFTALGAAAVDEVRRSSGHLTGPFMQDRARVVNRIFTFLRAALLYQQQRQEIEPLARSSCRHTPTERKHQHQHQQQQQ
jgi:hypothetical protein